jgi:hypothetical protein
MWKNTIQPQSLQSGRPLLYQLKSKNEMQYNTCIDGFMFELSRRSPLVGGMALVM